MKRFFLPKILTLPPNCKFGFLVIKIEKAKAKS